MKHRFKAARLLPEQLADGLGFVTNFNESAFLSAVHSGAREARPESIVKRVMPTGGFRACAQGGASPGNHFRLTQLDGARDPKARNADGVGSSSRRRVDESQLTIRQIPRYRRKLCLHIEAVFVTANDPKYDIRTPDMSAERGPMLTIRFDEKQKRKFENVEVTYRPRACERPRCWIFVDCNRTGERG